MNRKRVKNLQRLLAALARLPLTVRHSVMHSVSEIQELELEDERKIAIRQKYPFLHGMFIWIDSEVFYYSHVLNIFIGFSDDYEMCAWIVPSGGESESIMLKPYYMKSRESFEINKKPFVLVKLKRILGKLVNPYERQLVMQVLAVLTNDGDKKIGTAMLTLSSLVDTYNDEGIYSFTCDEGATWQYYPFRDEFERIFE